MIVGRKLFYDKITGLPITDTGEWHDVIREKTVDEEIASYPVLSERNRETFDVLELPFGAYAQDFAESNGYRVNVETKELEFSYPDPNEPKVEQPFQAPLSAEVAGLKKENNLMKAQSQANSDRADFQEELIVELAMLLYS